MGLFDFFNTSESESSSSSQFAKETILDRELLKESARTRAATSTEQAKIEAERAGEKTAQQTALQTTLSEENVAILDQVIRQLSGKQSGADALGILSEQLPTQLSDTLAQLVSGSSGFDVETARIKEGLVTSARNEFERGTGRQIRIGADATLGSRLGSTSQLIEEEAQVNLSAQLAGLGAGVEERRSVERRNQLLATLQGLASGEKTAAAVEGDPLSQLLSALQVASQSRQETVSTGAEQTRDTATQISESQKQADELIELISKIVENAKSTTTGTASTLGEETKIGSDIGFLGQLASGFADIGTGIKGIR